MRAPSLLAPDGGSLSLLNTPIQCSVGTGKQVRFTSKGRKSREVDSVGMR